MFDTSERFDSLESIYDQLRRQLRIDFVSELVDSIMDVCTRKNTIPETDDKVWLGSVGHYKALFTGQHDGMRTWNLLRKAEKFFQDLNQFENAFENELNERLDEESPGRLLVRVTQIELLTDVFEQITFEHNELWYCGD